MPKPAPLVGSPAARSTTVCDHRNASSNSPTLSQFTNAVAANPMIGMDRRSSRPAHIFRCPAREASAACPAKQRSVASAVMPMANRLIPHLGAQPQLHKAGLAVRGLLALESLWRTTWYGELCT